MTPAYKITSGFHPLFCVIGKLDFIGQPLSALGHFCFKLRLRFIGDVLTSQFFDSTQYGVCAASAKSWMKRQMFHQVMERWMGIKEVRVGATAVVFAVLVDFRAYVLSCF